MKKRTATRLGTVLVCLACVCLGAVLALVWQGRQSVLPAAPQISDVYKRQVEDCVVYASITAGAEEIAVLRMTDEDAAKAALEALKGRVEDQIAALKDYQPEEVGKLDGAILDRQGTTVLLAVPALAILPLLGTSLPSFIIK